jgi:hypothetical protein
MEYIQRKGKGLPKQLESINVHAAGVDIGAEMHFAAVPPREGEEEAVRSFGCFTADLHALADWFEQCGVETVAMESTGVYWMPVYRVLELRGFEVLLANARHIKYVPGRKTDVVDCQWIQTLHAYGLLRGSFVPPKNIDQLCAYWRQRKMLVESCSREVQHMQKALTQMNLHLSVVLSDVTGVTGMKIIRAMVQGERDPRALARFRHGAVKKSEEEIVKALTGHYSDEHLFCLRQALELYDTFQKSIADCDTELQKHMARFERKEPQTPFDAQGHKKHKTKKRTNEPAFDLRAEEIGIALLGHIRPVLGLEVIVAQFGLEGSGRGTPVVAPVGHGGQGHEDRFGASLGLEAEDGSPVVDQVELDVAAASVELEVALRFGVLFVLVGFDHGQVEAWEGHAQRDTEVEMLLFVCSEVVVEDTAYAAHFVAVF